MPPQAAEAADSLRARLQQERSAAAEARAKAEAAEQARTAAEAALAEQRSRSNRRAAAELVAAGLGVVLVVVSSLLLWRLVPWGA